MSDLMVSDSLQDRIAFDIEDIREGSWMVSFPFSGTLKSFGVFESKKFIEFTTHDIHSGIKLFEGNLPLTFIINNDKLDFKYEVQISNPDITVNVISPDTIQMIIKDSSNANRK